MKVAKGTRDTKDTKDTKESVTLVTLVTLVTPVTPVTLVIPITPVIPVNSPNPTHKKSTPFTEVLSRESILQVASLRCNYLSSGAGLPCSSTV